MNTTKMDKLRDFMTWFLCYEQGLRKPRFPVPCVNVTADWFIYTDSLTHEESICVLIEQWNTVYMGEWDDAEILKILPQ